MVSGNGNGAPAPDKLQLVITWDPKTDAVMVNGPIGNRTLAYGLLERARAILLRVEIQAETAAAKESVRRIVLADGPLPPLPGS